MPRRGGAPPAAAAGVFTRNRVKAAPVLLSRARLRRGQAQAIVVNSGNANACNGPQGLADARETTRRVAELLAIPAGLVLPASTRWLVNPPAAAAGASATIRARSRTPTFLIPAAVAAKRNPGIIMVSPEN